MVPQFGSVVVCLAGYQGDALLVPTVARALAFFAVTLRVDEQNSSTIPVLFYIEICG
jgi:hypothetical protein